MRLLIAPDSFKGSLSADRVAAALARGFLRAEPRLEIDLCPMADGGEGTVQAFLTALGGRRRELEVTGPLGRSVQAFFGLVGQGETAVLEAAAACGLHLVPPERRDPGATTTRGVGELLLAAREAGARRFILGIGGSATNDGGAGMLQALGARLLDRQGRELPPGGAALADLAEVDLSGWVWPPEGARVTVAADVTNPLCGPQGASAVYGPQKGATPSQVSDLDRALRHYAAVVARTLGRDLAQSPGAGAAGGLGFALLAFLGAELKPGVRLLMEAANFGARARQADLIVTGEGRLDAQTSFGKTAAGVAKAGAEAGVPVIALCGSVVGDPLALGQLGLSALSIAEGPASLEEMLSDAERLLEAAAVRAWGLIQAGRRMEATQEAGEADPGSGREIGRPV